MPKMLSLPSFLAFLLPLPALRPEQERGNETRRRRAIQSLHLPPHLLQDVGMEDYENPADDPRWSRRIDLER